MKPSALAISVIVAVACVLTRPAARAAEVSIVVSIPDQKLAVIQNGVQIGKYSISTSKFGLGNRPSSFATPLGLLTVASKVGAGAPLGSVFKGRRLTGEVLPPNVPGRDPIVTRILQLRGLQSCNTKALGRGIYIHGTTDESNIGRPASFGCIRMRSRDVLRVFDETPVGSKIKILNCPIKLAVAQALAEHRVIASN